METPINSQIFSYKDNSFREGLCLSEMSHSANDARRRAENCRHLARSFSANAFTNLHEFPYLYFTAGVTEAIDFLIPKQRVTILKNEYRYLRAFPNVCSSEDESTDGAFFLSYPFSGTGRFEAIPDRKNIILDCSYFFASNMRQVDSIPDGVSHVLFGLTKSHNLADARIGWMFSRQKILTYHVLQYDYGYLSGLYLPILSRVVKSAPNELYLKYKDNFSKLFKDNHLEEGDTNLFGLNDNGTRVPYYLLENAGGE